MKNNNFVIKKMLAMTVTIVSIVSCLTISGYAKDTSTELGEDNSSLINIEKFIKSSLPNASQMDELLGLKTPDGKSASEITENNLVHRLYQVKNDGSLERNMFETYSGDFSNELDYNTEMWQIPVMDNGNVIGEYGYTQGDGSLLKDNYTTVKNDIGFGIIYDDDKLIQILSSKEIGEPIDIKSVYITFPNTAIFMYVKTHSGEYIIPTRDIILSFYRNNKYSPENMFKSLTIYEADDLVKAYKEALNDRILYEKVLDEKNDKNNSSYIDKNGDSVINTPLPTTRPETTSTPNVKETAVPTIMPSVSPTPSADTNQAHTDSHQNNIDCSEWALDSITQAISSGFLDITLQNNYKMPINRNDFCVIVYSMLNNSKGVQYDENQWCLFSDTDRAEIIALANIGIINGRDAKTFAPNDSITREEAASILARVVDYLDISIEPKKTSEYNDDDSIADWAKENVYKLKQFGIMEGIDDNKFSPQAYYTKEQAVATIMRIYDYIESK